MHGYGYMEQRQPKYPPPSPLSKKTGHADHFEAASWNGPAHADQTNP